MKIQIDTNAKTIKIEGDVKLSDLFDTLQKFFPSGEWEDYDLQTNTVIQNWGSPIIINKPYPYPWWHENPTYVVSGTSGTIATRGSSVTSSVVYHGTVNESNCFAGPTKFGGPMVIDMSNEPEQEYSTSGYVSPASGIYNIELN